jgi:hypothetical protein
MSNVKQARAALVTRILEGPGKTTPSERRAAFNNSGVRKPLATLVDKVATHSSTITDADLAVPKASGVGEDQAFEIVVCAAIGQAIRQYEAALSALEATAR